LDWNSSDIFLALAPRFWADASSGARLAHWLSDRPSQAIGFSGFGLPDRSLRDFAPFLDSGSLKLPERLEEPEDGLDDEVDDGFELDFAAWLSFAIFNRCSRFFKAAIFFGVA
jgi:hypothetical protein